ncbi:hypothetical protein ILUMI_26284 [Ignelater luminosus]|uniref:Uncharacterized protein n=1 Tax=Ignelater luminosus TaxID=2038154 RepID=A0A8K0C607_IGNLU|nr:hypothetical protein ILUMI_26284 [Ignelater luminosus]
MEGNKKISNTLNDLDREWPVKVIKCFENQHVLKCFESLLEEKSQREIELDKIKEETEVSVARKQSSSAETLTVNKVITLMDSWRKSLAIHLQQEVSDFLKQENVTNIYGLAMKYFGTKNNTSDAQEETDNNKDVIARKMKSKMSMKNMIPFMLVPGLLLAGIMPWVIPKLKMLVMAVGMLNQMAFTGALFSLVRGYVFDSAPNEHIFYINHGYLNEKHHQHKHKKDIRRNDIILKPSRRHRQSTISQTIKRFNNFGSYCRISGQGYKKSTDARDERYLMQVALRNRRSTSLELSRALTAARNKPATAPLLAREHRVTRLRFAREHVNWTIDDWKRVLFSDETRESLNSPGGRQRVWRKPGERFAASNISPRIPFCGGSIMFWRGICFYGSTNLLPRSPDMNPIEHLQDALNRSVRRHIPAPMNFRELEQVVLVEWKNIPLETIHNLINSMPRHMEAVIRASLLNLNSYDLTSSIYLKLLIDTVVVAFNTAVSSVIYSCLLPTIPF